MLIIRHLEGTLNQDEAAQFNLLIQTDTGFAREVEDFEALWKNSRDLDISNPDMEINAEGAWTSFVSLRDAESGDMQQKASQTLRMWNGRMLLRVAAVALIALVSVIAINESRRDTFKTGITLVPDQNHETLYSLADGSETFLASNSRLEVDESYNRDRRNTRLSGTAFFVVKPDKDRVFEVATSHLKTIVKGTTFLIRTDDHSTTVGVNTGVVQVLVGNQTETLHAGEQIFVSKGGVIERSDLNVKEVSQLMSSTKSMQNASLRSILFQIKLLYNFEISAAPEVLNRRYTVDLSQLDAESVPEMIGILTQLSLHKKGENYVLMP